MSQTKEVKDFTEIKSSSLQESSKRKSSKHKEIAWMYVYHTMCASLTTTMIATNQENKAFAATQSAEVRLNNELLKYQNLGLPPLYTIDGNKSLIEISNPNNDWSQCQAQGGRYIMTFRGKTVHTTLVTIGMDPVLGPIHHKGYKFGSLAWQWTNLSATNCKNIFNKLKELGIKGAGFYRHVTGDDFKVADENNERVTAQRDFLTNQVQTMTQGAQLQSGNINTMGQIATQQIDLISDVANEIDKLGGNTANI